MSKIFSSILIIPLFLICSELLPPTAHVEWNIIQNDEIWIGWTDYEDLQWCRAKSTLYAPIEKISTIIEDKANPEKNSSHEFKSIEIFKASDMMVDSLTQLLQRERSKKAS